MKEDLTASGKRTEGGLYIGLMSGTSLDGIDAALMEFTPEGKGSASARLNMSGTKAPRSGSRPLSRGKTATSARRSSSTALLPKGSPLRLSRSSEK